MSQHHKLDISPIPKKVLFINETEIADPNSHDFTESEEDNVRVYVPLDLNQSVILSRLKFIHCRLGDPTESNEYDYSLEVQRIITQLEIYDQIWCTRESNFPKEPDEHWHSEHARNLVEKILNVLEKWEKNSCAECFPYEQIDELEAEYGITREHGWK